MSVMTYIRLRSPLEEAMGRYGRWIGAPEVEPPRLVLERDAIDLSLDDGEWRGQAVFVYACGPWTVFDALSVVLDMRSAADWLKLAGGGDLVFASGNDAINYGQVVVIEAGRLIRHCLQDDDHPEDNVDVGRLPEEADRPLEDWIDLMGWVEEDKDKLDYPDQGWLWIHQFSSPLTDGS